LPSQQPDLRLFGKNIYVKGQDSDINLDEDQGVYFHYKMNRTIGSIKICFEISSFRIFSLETALSWELVVREIYSGGERPITYST